MQKRGFLNFYIHKCKMLMETIFFFFCHTFFFNKTAAVLIVYAIRIICWNIAIVHVSATFMLPLMPSPRVLQIGGRENGCTVYFITVNRCTIITNYIYFECEDWTTRKTGAKRHPNRVQITIMVPCTTDTGGAREYVRRWSGRLYSGSATGQVRLE